MEPETFVVALHGNRMKSVYVETSILSYLTARPSANLVVAARQRLTCDWWESERSRFDIYISPFVETEASRGDPLAAKRRLAAAMGIPNLEIVPGTTELASRLLEGGALPKKAEDDATHIALAAIHGIDYLLTWNCRHINNAETKPLIRTICSGFNYPCPEICTPEELMRDETHEG
uniref:Predicted nucleic acid-binding protein, contains PIN domain n=1 Tax=Candidatus Kentrum sp. DK TaxID=2126562 RepID=A0A450SVU0_9GAMM|nr:MAG: Predicted nucleic acid-binding protein, contains PIN domain [Candidatus Kentron sp. DK]